jgi:hypothetical protein
MSERGEREKSEWLIDEPACARLVARVADEAGVKAVLIGRYAIWTFLGRREPGRKTKDLDVAVRRVDLEVVRRWMGRQGFPFRNLSIGGVNIRFEESRLNVDFIDRSDPLMGDFGGLFTAAVDASSETVEIGGLDIPLVPLPYLVAMKFLTGDDKDRKDVLTLLEARPDTDVDLVRKLFHQHAPALIPSWEAFLRKIGHHAALVRNYRDDGSE